MVVAACGVILVLCASAMAESEKGSPKISKKQAIAIAKKEIAKAPTAVQPKGEPVKVEVEEGWTFYDPVGKEYVPPIMKISDEIEARKVKRATWIVTFTYRNRPELTDRYMVEVDQTSGEVAEKRIETK